MTREELNKVLENHKHWIYKDCEGWECMKADLRYADLFGANLCGADLRSANLNGANLNGADLRGANLSYADLSDTNLCGADLSDTNLCGARLSGASLSSADLRYANLRGANLSYADLRYAELRDTKLSGANLSYAELSGANLRGADISGATLSGAKLSGATNIPFIPYTCPDTGSFIGYKKASRYIVELEILSDAKRCSATGRICRCNKAKVLNILNLDRSISYITEICSNYDRSFIYKVGEIVEEPNFCDDRWNECSEGIRFFINFQEAVNCL